MTAQELMELKNVWFRITTEDDKLNGNSAELPDFSREEAAETFGTDVADLDDTLEEKGMFYSEDEGGVYWKGVCCWDSLEGIKDYWENQLSSQEDFELVVFKGEYLGDCCDGDVASVDEVIERLPVTILEEVE